MSTLQALKNNYIIVGLMLVLEGLSFLILPDLTTKLLLVSPLETEQARQYARLAGLAITVIGSYYCVAGKHELIGFFRASVFGRMLILPVISAMIYFYSIEVSFILFGIQDFLTAIWSYYCLKAYDAERAKRV